MDYLEIRELYHADLMEKEKARIISEFEIFNTDFLDDLPYQVRNVLDSLKWRFRTEDWFPEAWEKYRQHVLEAGLGGEIKMPGYIFNPYLERYVDEHFRESNNNLGECRYSDMEIGEYLAHHGIKGQKWGIRRFQNKDGSFTEEGKKRYGINSKGIMSEEGEKQYDKDRQKSKRIKVAVTVGTVAAGAAIATALVAKYHNVKIKNALDVENKAFNESQEAWGNYRKFEKAWDKKHPLGSQMKWNRDSKDLWDKYESANKAFDKAFWSRLDIKEEKSFYTKATAILGAIGTVPVASLVNAKENKSIRKDKDNYRSNALRNLNK